jgi:hypothetical protein
MLRMKLIPSGAPHGSLALLLFDQQQGQALSAGVDKMCMSTVLMPCSLILK